MNELWIVRFVRKDGKEETMGLILDTQQCGNLSAGDQGQTQTAVGRRTSVYHQSH